MLQGHAKSCVCQHTCKHESFGVSFYTQFRRTELLYRFTTALGLIHIKVVWELEHNELYEHFDGLIFFYFDLK